MYIYLRAFWHLVPSSNENIMHSQWSNPVYPWFVMRVWYTMLRLTSVNSGLPGCAAGTRVCMSPQSHSMTTVLSKPAFDTFALTCVPQMLQARRCKIFSKSPTFKSTCSAFLSVVTAVGMTIGRVDLAAGGVSQPKELPPTSVRQAGVVTEEMVEWAAAGVTCIGWLSSSSSSCLSLFFLSRLSFSFFTLSCIARVFFEAFGIADRVNARYWSRKKLEHNLSLLNECPQWKRLYVLHDNC